MKWIWKMGSNPKIQIILILAITTWRGREYTKAIEIDNLREREKKKTVSQSLLN